MQKNSSTQPLSPEAIEAVLRGLDREGPGTAFAFEVPGIRLVRELHRGGQGVVYLGVQLSTRRPVAVKVFLDGGGRDQVARKRFLREVRLIANLHHSHIVTLHDSGETSDGRLYYVMEYVHGLPLRAYIHEHKLSLRATLELFALLCETVEVLHAHGIVHRDLKPSNVLVDSGGRLVLLDLGLAVTMPVEGETIISQPGDLLGTLAYMSPEQASMRGDELDARSDVYSLGVMLYEILSGQLPYSTRGAIDVVLRRIREEPARPLRQSCRASEGTGEARVGAGWPARDIEGSLEIITGTALAKERHRRYATAGKMAGDLRRFLNDEPIEARAEAFSSLLRSRTRRHVQHNKAVAALLGITISALLASTFSHLLLYRMTRGDQEFERWAAATLIPRPDGQSLEHVRVIAIQDDTDMTRLAARFNLTDVSDATPEVVPSTRRLHGRLMEHLAESRCQVVVWDMTFRKETEFDGDFLRGVRALRASGIPVVVGVATWWSGDLGVPALSPPIAVETRRGCTAAWFYKDEPWAIPLMVHKATGDTLGALTLEGLAAVRFPFAETQYSFDLQYGVARARRASSKHRELGRAALSVALTSAHHYDKEKKPSASYGLREGDSSVEYQFTVPHDEVLAAATIPYHEIFGASTETLRTWFAHRVVVVGNLRSGNDRHGCPGGRSVAGAHGHAAALNQLLATSYYRLPAKQETSLGAWAGAGLGCAFVLGLRRASRYVVVWIVTMLAFVSMVWFAARVSHWIFNPAGLVLGLTLVVLFCAGSRRAFGWPASTPSESNA